MLLTRKAWYGLVAMKRLAEPPRESSFSAKDLADLYGLPQEALAKILQRLAGAGLLLSHHGIKGGYTLARDPQQGATRDGIHGKHWRDLESLPGYHNCAWSANSSRMRCTGLRSRTSRNKPPAPPKLRCSALPKLARRSVGRLLLTYTGGLVAVKSNLVSFETGRRLLMMVGEQLHS
jgi:Iron-dependent Transcriptional regulator